MEYRGNTAECDTGCSLAVVDLSYVQRYVPEHKNTWVCYVVCALLWSDIWSSKIINAKVSPMFVVNVRGAFELPTSFCEYRRKRLVKSVAIHNVWDSGLSFELPWLRLRICTCGLTITCACRGPLAPIGYMLRPFHFVSGLVCSKHWIDYSITPSCSYNILVALVTSTRRSWV